MTCEAIYCFDTAAVRFVIYPEGGDGPRILAEVSEHALRDLFGARGGAQSLLVACQEHFALIEAEAVRAYRQGRTKAVRLETRDLAVAAARNKKSAATGERHAHGIP